MPKKIIIPKEQLEDLYTNQQLTIREVADTLGYSVSLVFHSLKRHGIPSNPLTCYTRRNLIPLLNEIRDLYLKQKWTLTSLAKYYKTTPEKMRAFMVDNGIKIRSISESLQLSALHRVIGEDGHGWNWQGGRRKSSVNGYWVIWQPEHHRADKRGYVYEHIAIWENANNKRLPNGWLIHHLNGIKTDNRPENLEAMSKSAHKDLAKPYKQRIRQLEARIVELEAQLKNHNLFTLPPISSKLTSSLLLGS